jgi:hypothetical protein
MSEVPSVDTQAAASGSGGPEAATSPKVLLLHRRVFAVDVCVTIIRPARKRQRLAEWLS